LQEKSEDRRLNISISIFIWTLFQLSVVNRRNFLQIEGFYLQINCSRLKLIPSNRKILQLLLIYLQVDYLKLTFYKKEGLADANPDR